jgi:hypothetical protein
MATITAKELAEKCDTDARTVRKFLRSHFEETPGKGSRYAIEKRQVKSLVTAFNKWDAGRKAAAEAAEDITAEVEDKLEELIPED